MTKNANLNADIKLIVTILHMVMSAIWPEESFVASWQRFWFGAVGAFPEIEGESPSRGTVSNSRKRLPTELWDKLFTEISKLAG